MPTNREINAAAFYFIRGAGGPSPLDLELARAALVAAERVRGEDEAVKSYAKFAKLAPSSAPRWRCRGDVAPAERKKESPDADR